MTYNREEMRRALANVGVKHPDTNLDDILDTIESTLKVGKECICYLQGFPPPSDFEHSVPSCPLYVKEEKCTCPDKDWVQCEGVHYKIDCPFFREPVKLSLPPLPEKKPDLDLSPGFSITAEYRLGEFRGYNQAIEEMRDYVEVLSKNI